MRLVLRLVDILAVVVAAARAMGWRNPSVVGDEDFLVAVGEFCDGGAEGHVCVVLALSLSLSLSSRFVVLRTESSSS